MKEGPTSTQSTRIFGLFVSLVLYVWYTVDIVRYQIGNFKKSLCCKQHHNSFECSRGFPGYQTFYAS